MKKKIIAIILTLVLTVSILPSAFAEQNPDIDYDAGYKTLVNSNFVTYETLKRNSTDQWDSIFDYNEETYYVVKTTGVETAAAHKTCLANVHGTVLGTSYVIVDFDDEGELPSAAVGIAQNYTSIKLRIYKISSYSSSTYGMKTTGHGSAYYA